MDEIEPLEIHGRGTKTRCTRHIVASGHEHACQHRFGRRLIRAKTSSYEGDGDDKGDGEGSVVRIEVRARMRECGT